MSGHRPIPVAGLVLLLGLGASLNVGAVEWQFESPLTLHEAAAGTRLALGESGLAARADRVAVVWSESAAGRHDVRLVTGYPDDEETMAFTEAAGFSQSGRGESPTVVPVGERDRFALLWTEDERLHGRLWRDGLLDTPLPLDGRSAQAPRAVARGREAELLWLRPEGSDTSWVRGRLRLEQEQLGREWLGTVAADKQPGQREQPAMAVAGVAIILVWVQERSRYTRIHVARSADPASGFGRSSALNPLPEEPQGAFGRDPLVDQPVVASDGNRKVVAIWLEERGDGVGPRLRAVVSEDGGRRFPAVEEVLGGEPEAAYRSAPHVAVSPLGLAAVAWESRRTDWETGEPVARPVIKVSSRDGNRGWQEPVPVPVEDGGSGVRQPRIHLDGEGHAHLVWVEGEPEDGMRVRYIRARIQPD